MFAQAVNFNQPLADWDISAVTNLSCMFAGAKELCTINLYNLGLIL